MTQNNIQESPPFFDSSTPEVTQLPDSSAHDTMPDIPKPVDTSTRPVRTRHMPSHLSDYVCNQSNSLAKQSSSGISYPISEYHSLENLSQTHHAYTTSVTHTLEPTSYNEACKHECWQQAMKNELDVLAKTGTWVLVDGYTKSNIRLMGPLRDTKQDWLPKVTTR
jgi:hypothetical protein